MFRYHRNYIEVILNTEENVDDDEDLDNLMDVHERIQNEQLKKN